MNDLANITSALEAAFEALMAASQPGLRRVETLVVGCSTSEIAGAHIGKQPMPALGQTVAQTIDRLCKRHQISWAAQCCEHLNRALVMERKTARALSLTTVFAVPHPEAGGSFGAAAYRMFEDPVLAESLLADAGIDIGDTFIGMHLLPVAVPVRPPADTVGHAHLTMARTRDKLIGGARAKYSL